MLTTYVTILSAGCFLLSSAGKMVYYNDRVPAETVPSPYYWPNQNILPSDEPDAVHYPTWFQLPWRPFPTLQQPVIEVEPEKITVPPEVESPPSTTTDTPDETPEGRHLHHEKPHKHHHKHKHHKHKHHHHHHHDKGTKTAGTPLDESDELQGANVGQLKMVILQLEHKLQELKLQLFGSRTLTADAVTDNDNDDAEEDAARFEVGHSSSDSEASEEIEQLAEELSHPSAEVVGPTSTEKDEGKLLLEENDKPAAELVLEHRESESNPFDNGRSLAENVQKWFEGLDLGKIAALPLEESVESDDVSGTIDVRGQF